MASVHKTVLLHEAIDGLNLSDGATVVDGTFGGGGHSAEICKRFPKVKIIAIDQDGSAFEKAESKFTGLNCDIHFVNENFRNIDKVVNGEQVDGVILDLGLSSDQLENSGRGFSFMKDEPLLMQMKYSSQYLKNKTKLSAKENPLPEEEITAYEVVNSWSEESLANIIYGYGEERLSRRIAKGIVEARKKKKIATTFELVEVIKGVVPAAYIRGKIHFATRTFQALRIAVNDELGALTEGLIKGFDALKVEGRMSVITFHSLEDRIVKKFFRELEERGEGRRVNKKVILASREEIISNLRSRSAKLRIIERIEL